MPEINEKLTEHEIRLKAWASWEKANKAFHVLQLNPYAYVIG